MAIASSFLVAANDEHGMNPPTVGKRTPVLPYIDRSFYENEYNRPCKYRYLQGMLRVGTGVLDVKPEIEDIPVSTRVARVNRANVTLLTTFGYNAYGNGTSFNNVRGAYIYYGRRSRAGARSINLANDIFSYTAEAEGVVGRGVASLTDIGVLESVYCPSVISEAGFMTNYTEAKLMLDPDFVTNVAEATVQGTCEYLGIPYSSRDNLSNYPTLRRGNVGNKVKLLQYNLQYYGYDVDVDGVFGADTLRAVQDFQTRNGLTIDGIVGRATWTALLFLNPTSKVLRRGARNSSVKYAQLKLLSKLYPLSIIDGVYGAETENAVKDFQRENSLTVDGIVGRNTWAKLSVLDQGRPLT